MLDNIKPKFNELESPDSILSHVENLVKVAKPFQHAKILNKLIEQIKPIDFKLLAFPEIEKLRLQLKEVEKDSEEADKIQKQINRLKCNAKHYLILAVENVVKVAEDNNWSLCKNNDFIYLYNGTYWNELDKETFQKFLGEASEKMGVTKFSARFFSFREQLFKQFLSSNYLPTPQPDNDTVLINLQNGTFAVDTENICLKPFDRNDFLTYQLAFDFLPDAKAPIFQMFLDEVLPDKNNQKVLAEYIGYLFIRHGGDKIKIEKALILFGGGANGKSVFFEVINRLLGADNTSNYSLQSITDDTGYYRAKLANKLVNYGSEINGKLESSLFKQLTSGEPVEARLPYGQPFIMKQYAKLIFNSNELPKDVEHTNAYFRRFLIIPFDVTIPPEKQDKTLHVKIIENELSGVFNWVLDGLKRLLEQKSFTESKTIDNAVEQFKNQSDSVKMFVDDNQYKSSATEYILIKDLYFEYCSYCFEDGYRRVGKKVFMKRLSSYHVEVTRKNVGNVAYLYNGNKRF